MPELDRKKIGRLAEALNAPETVTEAAEIMRGLINRIMLTPVDGELRAELHGDLAVLARFAQERKGDLVEIRRDCRWLRGPNPPKVSHLRCALSQKPMRAALVQTLEHLAEIPRRDGFESREYSDVAYIALQLNSQPRHPTSRFARWASLRRIRPGEVDDRTIELFIAELDGAALVRNLRKVRRTVARCWNSFARRQQTAGLRPVTVPTSWTASTGIPWRQLPAAFREDVEEYLVWAAVPDPLAEGAREKALAPSTLRLRRTQIQVAARAAVAAGIPVGQLTSLASLVEPDTFRAILRHRWHHDGRTLSFFTNGLAEALIEIGAKWAKASPDVLSELKALRRRLGTLPAGLTEKNQGLLRKFDDPRLVPALVQLPDRLWRAARRGLATERRPFIALQSALAIDLLLYAPLRMQNLASLSFDQHLHWPQGRRKPAMVTFRADETKNGAPLELEIPPVLAERLQVYRNEIAPAVIGRRPNAVFVSLTGTPRSQTAIKLAIQTTVLRHLGVKITPHQFRHLAAKIALRARMNWSGNCWGTRI